MAKRQRTTWRYIRTGQGRGLLRVGWVHNPNYEPKEDVIRIQMMNSAGTYYVHAEMTVIEAISLAAGLTLTVQHHLWQGLSGEMPPLHVPRQRRGKR